MAHPLNLLGIDLGAESGRIILGQFDGHRLQLRQAHRFWNGAVSLPDGLHWDVLRLWTEIKQGIASVVREGIDELHGIGVDAWSVDYALLDSDGALVSNPYHYRDSRTEGILGEAFRRMPREQVFELTGIQILRLNTLFQLLSMVASRSPALDIAATILSIPDLMNYWMTGRAVFEFSVATGSQCYDPRRQCWSEPLLQAMDIPLDMFPEVVPSATILGPLLPAVAEEVGLKKSCVIAPVCHDTGSAVAAVPASSADFVFISSGTWSVLGTELQEPLINDQSLLWNFTNEGGMGGTFRFGRDIMGLWLVQECRRLWASRGEAFSYSDLTALAAEAPPLRSVVDPDHEAFFEPGDMPSRIQAFCRDTDQEVPETKAAIVRCALESLALKYRWVLERLEDTVGRRAGPIHIVGGGAQNRLLCQFTADATGRRVVSGPIEATAAGNILVQAMALGRIASLEQLREVLRESFSLTTYEPSPGDGWDEAYDCLLDLVELESWAEA